MQTTSEFTGLVEELAAHWTEPVLEILKSAGLRKISVDTELRTWRTLASVLRHELRWQQAFRVSTLRSLSTLMEQVFRKTALQMGQSADGDIDAGFEQRVRRLAADRYSTAAERRLYGQLVREPALHAAFKPPSRTDFTPRLRDLGVMS